VRYFTTSIISFGFLIFCCSEVYAQDNHLEASARFFNAGSLYKQGDYKGAIEQYEEIIKNGLTSGYLYYNLGNSYFKKGDLGRAILNYERARTLIPRDSDLESNYHYANSLIVNYNFDVKHPLIHRLIHGYSDQITVNELTTISFLLALLIGIFHLAGLFLKWTPKISWTAMVVLSFLFVFHIFFLVDKIHYQNNLAIVFSKTDSKYEPIEKATTHFELPEGSKVQIMKRKGEWVKIQRSDGKTGWSKKDRLEKIIESLERGEPKKRLL